MEHSEPTAQPKPAPQPPTSPTKAPKSKTQLKAEARLRQQQQSLAASKPPKFQPLSSSTLSQLTTPCSPSESPVSPAPDAHTPQQHEQKEQQDIQQQQQQPQPQHTTVLQRTHVFEVYERIAEGFHVSRTYVWAPVQRFFEEIDSKPRSLVLDAGCGNCKHLVEYGAKHIMIGVDISRNLLRLGKSQNTKEAKINAEYLQANVSFLPFKENTFDYILCTAVIVHFPLHEQRLNVLKELGRCLKPGGKVLVSVWAKDGKTTTPHSDVLVPFSLENLPKTSLVEQSEPGEDAKNLTTARYYHMFSEDEFAKTLFQALPNYTTSHPIISDHDNYIQTLQKPN